MIDGPFRNTIKNLEELRGLFGSPSDLVNNKVIDFLDDHVKAYILKTPLLFVATSDSNGRCDASPRGDRPGFVHVVDDKHLVIPERPGNRRFDSLRNILSNPNVGLIFIIPGLKETLRINGRACLINDEEILSKLKVQGKRPWLGIGVRVEECYIHCAKAFMRSGAWDRDTWLTPELLPIPSQILADHINKDGISSEIVSNALKESYEKRMY